MAEQEVEHALVLKLQGSVVKFWGLVVELVVELVAHARCSG